MSGMQVFIGIEPAALGSIAAKVERDWGGTGYVISGVEQGPFRSVLAEVRASDGGVFYVGSTRWSNTVWHEDADTARAALRAKAEEDARP